MPGQIEWKPGELGSNELRRILRDSLADLWRDSYRANDTQTHAGQGGRFCGILEAEIYAITGNRVRVEFV